MKKVLLLLTAIVLLSGQTVFSQYYYLTKSNPGENPGGLNTDGALPVGGGLPGGWATILSGANPIGTYSANRVVPFAFNFIGVTLNQYKVSNTGVLTFDVNTAVTPNATNTALPSVSIPSLAICIWGIEGSGNDDNIVTKTFGDAPNRQHWIMFSSYTLNGFWTYWAIVLEETTNKIYLVDQRHQSGITGGLTLGIQIDPTTAYQVKESPNVQPMAGTNASASDNIYYEFLQGTQADYDFRAVHLEMPQFASITAAPFDISGALTNRGATTITSLDLNYLVNGGNIVTESITGLNLISGNDYHFAHSTAWNPASPGNYSIEVWATNLNGQADENPGDDTLRQTIEISDVIPNLIDQYINGYKDTILGTAADGLDDPKDLDFHPALNRSELWVVNHKTENSGGTTVTYSKAGQPGQKSLLRQDGNAWHFMSLPTGIAFSNNGNFATSPGVFDANHNGGAPFTGPSLWSSDPNIYARPSGGNGSHLDMLHQSPLCMGIAHEIDNAFWVFDANQNDIVRYDFVDDHGPGNDDHSDARVRRFPIPVRRINGEIPCHLELDKSSGWLYIADNGNRRIVRLDINSGTAGSTPSFGPYEPLAEYVNMTGITWENYIDSGLVQPSGIDVIEDRLLVSDHSNGDIIIYNISGASPVELGRIQTGAPGIMGITVGPEGNIWYVNGLKHELHKVTPVLNTAIDKSLLAQSFSIYPNPSDGKFTIESPHLPNPSYHLTITNLLGQTILEDEVKNNPKKTYELASLDVGVYFVIISVNDRRIVKRMVIDK